MEQIQRASHLGKTRIYEFEKGGKSTCKVCMCWQHVTNVQMCCSIVTGEPRKGGGAKHSTVGLFIPFFYPEKEGDKI